MKYDDLYLDAVDINELAKYITSKTDINLQLQIVGDEYYHSFVSLDKAERSDIVLSSLKQMPEDVIESIIKSGDLR